MKYIFWSGFSSLEQADRADFPGHTPDEGVFPWMSNTTGVEELLLATVALQFIVGTFDPFAMQLRAHYAMFGADLAYGPSRH